MSISLIVTKSYDEHFNETGEQIALKDWLNFIEQDAALRIQTEPLKVLNPRTNALMWVDLSPGDSEILVGDEYVPFLHYFEGQLSMRYTDDLDATDSPRRAKVAEVAKHFGALITHDAGDDILKW